MFRTSAWRLALAVFAAVSIVTWLGMPYFDRILTAWSRVNAENQMQAAMRLLTAQATPLIAAGDKQVLEARLATLARETGLAGISICSAGTKAWATSGHRLPQLNCRNMTPAADIGGMHMTADASGTLLSRSQALTGSGGQSHWIEIAFKPSDLVPGQPGWRNFVLVFAALATLITALVVALLAWWLLRRWVSVLAGDIRSGRFFDDARSPRFSLPILSQVRKVLHEVEATQRLEIDYRENWTAQALQQVVSEHLRSEQIIVISNRQPYSHILESDGSIRVQVPASGMVTALEPIVRACAGVWIAHGSGTADRQAVDRNDHVRVPPQDPVYTLRRVWLSPEEEQGYYYGFSNEGLWPLCHLAYVRPEFRASDWQSYLAVNARFAAVAASEARSRRPLVLIQDFHFAVLPALLRRQLPEATIALFWHVPWPNSETFGVCPWKRELLAQLLGADMVGFHTLHDCQNFLATADRYIECQISHEHLTVTLRGHVCHVAPYPISIEWPPRWLNGAAPVAAARAAIRREHGLDARVQLGAGVERWDFTKGILERFQALELYFEQHPQQQGRLTFLQIAAPSRGSLPAYQELQRLTIAAAERVNRRYATANWRPIVLVTAHQEPEQVFAIYRAADFCMVNSLHDGMNLVAKEFVSARDDEDGVLILSTFAGASRELVEALLVNPFDVAETATAIASAMAMAREERRERMRMMRRTVRENNVYRWAGRMLTEAARIRQRQSLAAPKLPSQDMLQS